MNHWRKLLVVCSVVLVMILAGCSGETGADKVEKEYPVWELVDISGVELLDAEDDTMKYQVPADTWIPGTNVNGDVVVLLAESYGTEEWAGVNITTDDSNIAALNDDFIDSVSAALRNEMGMSVGAAELRSFDGNTVCYIETVVEYTDDSIDQMLKHGAITEEELENAGGREYFLSLPVLESLTVYQLLDGKTIICGGTYHSQEQKEAVLDVINIILQTIELK